MSAFLFTVSPVAIKSASTEELREALICWHAVVDPLDWTQYKMCNFKWDQASGFQANIHLAETELKQRAEGKNEPLPSLLVPGYNPPERKGGA